MKAGTIYDGALYSFIFDRQLRGLHRRVAEWANEAPAETALDACCGTGGLTFQLAERCRHVVGVDISRRMIAHAAKLAARRGVPQVDFQGADVTNLTGFGEHQFDVATVAMGLHEMPTAPRERALPELLRVAKRVVIVDFAVPMPLNAAGVRNRVFEFAAGPAHFRGFLDYTRRGGLPALIAAAGARIQRQRELDSKTLVLVELTVAT